MFLTVTVLKSMSTSAEFWLLLKQSLFEYDKFDNSHLKLKLS